jgi:hypothetical protein
MPLLEPDIPQKPPSESEYDQAIARFQKCIKEAKWGLKESARNYFGPRFSAFKLINRLLFKELPTLVPGGTAASLAEYFAGGGTAAILATGIMGALTVAGVGILLEDAYEINKWLDTYDNSRKTCSEDLRKELDRIGPVIGPRP